MTTPARLTVAGVAVGVAATLVAVQVWQAFALADTAAALRAFRAPLAATTQLALAPAWRFGAPVVILLALAAVARWWPRAVGYVAVAALALAVVVFTHLAASAPFRELAGGIR